MRPTRDNDAGNTPQLFQSNVAREHFRRNSEFPYLARDQVTVLTAGIKYGDLCVMRRRQIESYFRILSTMIFFALLKSACAFGMASIACRTSGSVLISYLRLSSTLNAVL